MISAIFSISVRYSGATVVIISPSILDSKFNFDKMEQISSDENSIPITSFTLFFEKVTVDLSSNSVAVSTKPLHTVPISNSSTN